MNGITAAAISPHVAELAGLDLPGRAAPVVRVLPAREVAVVLSRSRDPAAEVFLDRCRADGVPVVVRPSGGGAVVLAPGVLTASVLAEVEGEGVLPERHFQRFCGAVAAALARVGVAVGRDGVSDLTVGERKVAGTALRVWKRRALFQVSLLFDLDVALIERYLRAPSRQPAYRRRRGHREFLVTMREAGYAGDVEEVSSALLETLCHEVGV